MEESLKGIVASGMNLLKAGVASNSVINGVAIMAYEEGLKDNSIAQRILNELGNKEDTQYQFAQSMSKQYGRDSAQATLEFAIWLSLYSFEFYVRDSFGLTPAPKQDVGDIEF